MSSIKNKPVFRITFLAMCLAIYVVLSTFCPETQFFKITFDSIPLIFISVVSGPVDGMIVGALGSLLNDIFTGYLSVTTPIWMIPAIVRALIIGLLFKDKNIKNHKNLWVFSIIFTTILVSALNSGIMYIDGMIFEYPVELTTVSILIRLGAGIITSIVNIFLIPLLVKATSHFIPTPKEEKSSD